jgi:hypothetical protein
MKTILPGSKEINMGVPQGRLMLEMQRLTGLLGATRVLLTRCLLRRAGDSIPS